MKHTPILLIGNSPNQLAGSGHSWKELMEALCKIAGMKSTGNEEKPFTLHFEELLCHFRAARVRRMSGTERKRLRSRSYPFRQYLDLQFKLKVAERMRKLPVDKVHAALMKLPVQNILTTNYDFCLERAVDPEPKSADWKTRERQFSLFQRRKAGGRFVFHIHGEVGTPSTIVLGHEAYVESCANIRRYAHGKGNYHRGAKRYLKAKFRRGSGRIHGPHAWVDLFMLRDVHIVGFGLEFTEVDIWYLLSYKSRLRYESDAPADLKRSRIYFHYFADDSPRCCAKIALLESFGVECRCHPIPVGEDGTKNYRRAWKRLLKYLTVALSPRSPARRRQSRQNQRTRSS